MDWVGENSYVCLPVCLFFCVCCFICMRNCKASGSLVVSLWHPAPFWPMICPDGSRFANFIVDWMELPTFREAFIPGSCNSVFGNENLNFRMIALRIYTLRLLGICYLLCFVFFLFLSLFSWGRAASSEHAIAYAVSLLLSHTGMVFVRNLDESKIFPRFWKISGKICSRCYELPRDLFRVFKEC